MTSSSDANQDALKAQLDQRTVNVIKGLIMDGTRAANSGHPGGAMSSADFAFILFKEFLNYSPDDPEWFNRDRFVLSAGHESMLLYSLLALRGTLSLEDLREFRQLNSRTPGHPEHLETPGVDAGSGPLGQGFSMAVGMAAAEAMLRAKLGQDVIDHRTFVIASDGDFQEPVLLGSAALAGLWGLGRLIVYYDKNEIQITGDTIRNDITDYHKVFEGLGWNVIGIDGHDHAAIREALKIALVDESKPTLIIGRTRMAKGAALSEGCAKTHGAPLKPEEISQTKQDLDLPETAFYLPDDVVKHFRSRERLLRQQVLDWDKILKSRLEIEEFAELWKQVTTIPVTQALTEPLAWPAFESGTFISTRMAFKKALGLLAGQLPFLAGGSADLDPSCGTDSFACDFGDFNAQRSPLGRNLPFGVREFPMACVLNGLALHGGTIPFGATFLVFSDYERGALRMAALQKLPVLQIFTHDSFYVGEDGPTHQPVEQLSSLRLIPNMLVLRPADANETCTCLKIALEQKSRPSCLVLTRQDTPVLALPAMLDAAERGAYIIHEIGVTEKNTPGLIILASGSEVALSIKVADSMGDMAERLGGIRVVNVVSMRLFDEAPGEYRESVLPSKVGSSVARVAIEAGSSALWYKYVGLDGLVLGMDEFGKSAPAGKLADLYGFTVGKAALKIRDFLQGKGFI